MNLNVLIFLVQPIFYLLQDDKNMVCNTLQNRSNLITGQYQPEQWTQTGVLLVAHGQITGLRVSHCIDTNIGISIRVKKFFPCFRGFGMLSRF